MQVCEVRRGGGGAGRGRRGDRDGVAREGGVGEAQAAQRGQVLGGGLARAGTQRQRLEAGQQEVRIRVALCLPGWALAVCDAHVVMQ